MSGPVVIVTGACGGIGSAVARRLVADGARVVLTDRDAPTGDAGPATHPVCLDITAADAPATLIGAALERWGRLDALVSVAGIQTRTAAVDIDEQRWQHLLDVNLSSVYRLVRAAAPELAKTRGSVVAVSSMSADRAVPGIVPYGATKAALSHLCRGLAVELGAQGIRVNAVAPGYVETPMTAGLLADPDFARRKLERIPLGRFADGDDVADPILFLLSPAARYVTGATLPVDGGYAIT